jgi:hypothetical protein
MALYDSLFTMMDMTAAQLLVTAVSAGHPPRSSRRERWVCGRLQKSAKTCPSIITK